MNASASLSVQDLLSHTLAFCDDCLNRQDFEAAWQALCRAVSLAPNRPDLLSYRGRLALFLRDTETARRDFTEALKFDSRCSAALSGMARYHLDQGEMPEAEVATDRALGINPADEEAAQVKAELQAERCKASPHGISSMNSGATSTEREACMPNAGEEALRNRRAALSEGLSVITSMKTNPIDVVPGLEQEVALSQLIERAVEKSINSDAFRVAVQRAIYECAPELSRNLPFMLQVSESLKAANWLAVNVPLHKRFTHESLRKCAISLAPDDGLYLEFGVWKGHWMRKMALMKPVPFYGFDSFEGIPDNWSIYDKSHFDLEGCLPEVPPNVQLIKGWFDQTLPVFIEVHAEPVAFIHMDCDLYSSTKTVLDLLCPQLRAGTTIVLDDYFIEPGWEKAEFRAFHEFIRDHNMEFEYLGYVTDTPSTAVGVRLTKV
jgi:tetratricopeptide (TPR) repeat protein